MANQKAISVTIGIPDVEVMIWYNDVNLKIGTVEWNMPIPGVVAWVRIWDSNVSATEPVIDRTVGQGTGSESVPGNYRMVERSEPELGLTWYELPENITYTVNIRTI